MDIRYMYAHQIPFIWILAQSAACHGYKTCIQSDKKVESACDEDRCWMCRKNISKWRLKLPMINGVESYGDEGMRCHDEAR